jgi:hypothetical protein
LLEAWAQRPRETRRASGLFLGALTAALIAFLALCLALAYLLVRALLS